MNVMAFCIGKRGSSIPLIIDFVNNHKRKPHPHLRLLTVRLTNILGKLIQLFVVVLLKKQTRTGIIKTTTKITKCLWNTRQTKIYNCIVKSTPIMFNFLRNDFTICIAGQNGGCFCFSIWIWTTYSVSLSCDMTRRTFRPSPPCQASGLQQNLLFHLPRLHISIAVP